jgi:acetyltransferase-like isoleucine patch superfamily enzyme
MLLRFPKLFFNKNFIHPFSYISKNVSIGSGTNINGPCFLTSHVSIGKNCAIGYNLRVRVDEHSTKYPNMLGKLQQQNKFSSILKFKNKTSIGSGTWIGDNVIILGGINVGQGAVIGAGSIVTKNIPDYAIYAGNPAKLIRYRFTNKVIKELLDINWFDWDVSKIKKNKIFFNTDLSSYEGRVKDLII